jgi:uncharacterized LabA/DUF88 family protein
MDRVSILIDGSNFYHLVLKKLFLEETQFDFERFVKFLADGRTISDKGKRFYTGTVREKEGDIRTKEAMAKQTKLFTTLIKNEWEIRKSKLQIRTERISVDDRVVGYKNLLKLGVKQFEFSRLREKGIDVKLATDLIAGAVDDQYDTAIVVSSDSDLIPAIDWVRLRKGKKIEYIGFSIPDKVDINNSTNPAISLMTKTDVKRILIKSDLRSFINK